MEIIVVIIGVLVTLCGFVRSEKGQRGYSPAHNLRNYGTVEGRGLWLGGGWDGKSGPEGINNDLHLSGINQRHLLTGINRRLPSIHGLGGLTGLGSTGLIRQQGLSGLIGQPGLSGFSRLGGSLGLGRRNMLSTGLGLNSLGGINGGLLGSRRGLGLAKIKGINKGHAGGRY